MSAPSKPLFKTVDLEDGMPSVPTALARLNGAIDAARKQRCLALKIIHGYGSSGVGGSLRQALQAEMAQRMQRGEVKAFIAGEDWRISNQDSWELLNLCPDLRRDPDLGRGNKGISLVVL